MTSKYRFLKTRPRARRDRVGVVLCAVAIAILLIGVPRRSLGQSAATGALTGTVTDPTGSVVLGATIRISHEATGETASLETHADGTYLFPYLPPGPYHIEVAKGGFRVAVLEHVTVHVTETKRADARLEVGTVEERVVVAETAVLLQTDSAALGHVTTEQMVEGLPLVSRNYTQIITLSPGVSSEVNNAGGLGSGASSLASGNTGVSAAGGTTNSNDYQMNGVEVNDAFGGSVTGGVPVPNPDTIQEFKVQTGQYDASYGRSSGADVDVVTKTGSNQFHGTIFEFFRNDVLNANEFFRKAAGQVRPELKQNQFGFTLGGPIRKEKLLFFVSYQGSRQRNGVDPNCSGTFSSPPLTNDRSRGALGALFSGNTVAPIAADGSNIDPVALAVLQAKLPDGSYVIPTPQTINASKPFAAQGFSSFSKACPYSEDQYMANMAYNQSSKSRWDGRSFISDSNKVQTLPIANFTGSPALPGFPLENPLRFRVFSITHTYLLTPNLVNQAVVGFHRAVSQQDQSVPLVNLPGLSAAAPFRWSTLGASIDPTFDSQGPAGIVTPNSAGIGGFGIDTPYAQNYYDFQDSLTYVHGRNSFQFGSGLSRTQTNFPFVGLEPTVVAPQDWGAFLQGQTLFSADLQGLTGRALRAWNINGYGQDSIRVFPSLTVLVGLRYEFQGLMGDALGRASNIDLSRVDPNPQTDTLKGYVVGSNFHGTLPAGVTRAANSAALNGNGQNTFGPRLGFSWKLPRTNRFVVRGGYGIYYSRTTGQPFFQLVASPPFSLLSNAGGPPLDSPFAPPFTGIPFFPPFSQNSQSSLTPTVFEPNFRAPIIQNYSTNLQTQLAHDLVLEVGYVGARGTHLVEQRLFNQALSASPSHPVNGATSNTYGNILQRAPYQEFFVDFSGAEATEGINNYNALLVSLKKRFSNGLQFLASYTWAKDLTDLGGYTGNNGGQTIGDQNDQRARYGRNDFVRPQRLVISYYYELPGPQGSSFLATKVLKGWAVSGVTVLQSGQPMGFFETNSLNAFGIGFGGSSDRPQLAPGCSAGQIVTPGSVNDKLQNYFKPACFVAPPVIGADGIATAFGDSGNGIVTGPDQRNFDIAVIKRIPLFENKALEFRAEFFNAFNTTNFSSPNTTVGTVGCNVSSSVMGTPCNPVPGGPAQPQVVLFPNPSFGQITSTSVNPRIIQFALKLNF